MSSLAFQTGKKSQLLTLGGFVLCLFVYFYSSHSDGNKHNIKSPQPLHFLERICLFIFMILFLTLFL